MVGGVELQDGRRVELCVTEEAIGITSRGKLLVCFGRVTGFCRNRALTRRS